MSATASKALDPYKPFPSLRGQKAVFTSSSPFTPTYVQSHTPFQPSAYTTRVEGRQLLLENPARESRRKKLHDARISRQKQDKMRRKAGILSRREAKLTGAWKLGKRDLKYKSLLPIHHMWCSYIAELLNLNPKPPDLPSASGTEEIKSELKMPPSMTMQSKLVKAEFHGAIIEVTQSKNVSLVGCKGIVIHETENTFKVVTSSDVLKVIPKENSIFAFEIPFYAPPPFELSTIRPPTSKTDEAGSSGRVINAVEMAPPLEGVPKIRFDLYGNQFRFRSSDRATRKFKPKETIEL